LRPVPKLLKVKHCRVVGHQRIEGSRTEVRHFHEQDPARARQADVSAPTLRGARHWKHGVDEARRAVYQLSTTTRRDAQLVRDGMSGFAQSINKASTDGMHAGRYGAGSRTDLRCLADHNRKRSSSAVVCRSLLPEMQKKTCAFRAGG
jgi:hypothetical protein